MATTQSESVVPVFDTVKQVLSVFILLLAIAAFYYFAEYRLLYRVLGLVFSGVVILSIMATTQIGRDVVAFMKESRQEVRKVIWPTRQETTQTTVMVFAMVFVVGLVLWLLDTFMFWVIKLLTGQGG